MGEKERKVNKEEEGKLIGRKREDCEQKRKDQRKWIMRKGDEGEQIGRS